MEGTTDPRITRTKAVVQAALVEVLEQEGATAITHQRIAERSGVSRTTLYRHWPETSDLVIEALALADEPLFRHDDGPLRDWLITQLTQAARGWSQPVSTQIMLTLVGTARHDHEVAEMLHRLLRRTEAPLVRAMEAAARSGEIETVPDPSKFLSAALGPLMFRVIVQGEDADEDFIERVVDGAITSWAS